ESVLVSKEGRAGIITLNRPKALNGLNLELIRALTRTLKEWESGDSIALVILRGGGVRELCARGDQEASYCDDRLDLAHCTDYALRTVRLMMGMVLGEVVRVSSHGSHRIVTDSTRLGMPEVGIGFAPDAGGSYILAQSPDRLGRHLAYTSVHVGAAEAIDLGFADYYVTDDQLDDVVEALASTGDAEEIKKFASDPGESFAGD